MEPLDQPRTAVSNFESVLDGLDAESRERHIRLRIEALLSRVRRAHWSPTVQSPIQHSASEATTSAQGEQARQNQEIEEGVRERHLRLRAEELYVRLRRSLRSPPVQSPIQSSTSEATTADAQVEDGRQNQEVEEGIVESRKRKSAHLVAKALGVEKPDATGKAKESTGNVFDCNICLEMATDPVLTCCGHLFCWPCFYQASYAYLNARECPVCKGEVAETGVIPIYGNGSGGDDHQLELKEASLTIPPRPRARRVESIRQLLISDRASSLDASIFHNAWRFSTRRRNGGLGEQVQLGTPNTTSGRNDVQLTQSRESHQQSENNQHTGSDPFSRLLEQRVSLSLALDSAMNSAERLFQLHESYIHSQQTGGSRQLNPRPESFTPDVAVTNSAAADSVFPLRRNLNNIAAMISEIQSTDNNAEISMFYHSSNGRRINDLSRRQPESLTPDVAVNNSVAAASVPSLRRNLDNIAPMISEIQSADNNAQISMLYPSSNSRRRNDGSRQVPDEPRIRRRRMS